MMLNIYALERRKNERKNEGKGKQERKDDNKGRWKGGKGDKKGKQNQISEKYVMNFRSLL